MGEGERGTVYCSLPWQTRMFEGLRPFSGNRLLFSRNEFEADLFAIVIADDDVDRVGRLRPRLQDGDLQALA